MVLPGKYKLKRKKEAPNEESVDEALRGKTRVTSPSSDGQDQEHESEQLPVPDA